MIDERKPFIMALALALPLLYLFTIAESAERPTGFRGIQWGTTIEKVTGLKLQKSEWKWMGLPLALYIRPSDTLSVAGFKLKEIGYIVDERKIVGVSVQLGEGQTGYVNCYFFRQILRSLYGKPDENEIVASFHNAERWFATRDEEASVELTCSKQGVEPKVAVYRLDFEWKGHARAKFNL